MPSRRARLLPAAVTAAAVVLAGASADANASAPELPTSTSVTGEHGQAAQAWYGVGKPDASLVMAFAPAGDRMAVSVDLSQTTARLDPSEVSLTAGDQTARVESVADTSAQLTMATPIAETDVALSVRLLFGDIPGQSLRLHATIDPAGHVQVEPGTRELSPDKLCAPTFDRHS